MITKAIIHQLDFNKNTCLVRVPLFESASATGPIILEALINNAPGLYNSLKVSDIVFIGFEEDRIEKPIVLGKMFLGAKREASTEGGAVNCNALQVSQSASVPASTKFIFKKTDNTDYSGLETPKQLADAVLDLDQRLLSTPSAGYLTRIYVDNRDENSLTEKPTKDNPILYGHIYLKTSKNFEEVVKDNQDLIDKLCSYLYQRTAGYLQNKPINTVFSSAETEAEYNKEQEYFHKPWVLFAEGFSGTINVFVTNDDDLEQAPILISKQFDCLSGVSISCDSTTDGTFILNVTIDNISINNISFNIKPISFKLKPEHIKSIQSMLI